MLDRRIMHGKKESQAWAVAAPIPYAGVVDPEALSVRRGACRLAAGHECSKSERWTDLGAARHAGVCGRIALS